ncbi:histidine kinase N-terminal 7TM domain-containing protein [Leptospira noguchii]|uniref:histidine kinase N-terminal 7TM domain-containing protein n=1 Tax=Leptospira noguchii TaxID=28182 RepID=UPI0007747BFE|nr:histidine kinase N-terminal 7TM domain-containing protein [Leptospira noguchii]
MVTAIFVSLFVFWLGIYVYRNSLQNESSQKWFLLFVISAGGWIFLLGMRNIVLMEWRLYYHHWTLIPILFTPHLFFRFAKSIFDPEYKMGSGLFVINTVGIAYFTYLAITCQFMVHSDGINYAYEPRPQYHLYIMYCVLYYIGTLITLWIDVRRYKQHKIQAILITIGTIITVSISVLFVYVLPMIFGIYLAPYSSIGVAIAGLFFAAAALLGNAFKLNALVDSGANVTKLNRVIVIVAVVIYRYVDPVEFFKKSETISEQIDRTSDKLWGLFLSLYLDDVDVKNRIREAAKEITLKSNF